MNRAVQEAGKRRSQRPSHLLRDYLKDLGSEYDELAAEREYLQAKIELVERQRTNLQEVLDIEEKLAELDQRRLAATAVPAQGSS